MASVWRVLALATVLAVPLRGDSREHPYPTDPGRLRLADVFELEWASDPQISPDGERVVYVRNFMDVMHDRRRSNLWLATTDGGDHRPLTTGLANHFAPRWSPDGRRLLYASTDDGSSQLHVRWLDGGGSARLTQLREPPADPAWSPDGRWIAFTMLAPLDVEPFVELPEKPAGAQWAAPAVAIDELLYRADGAGYLKDGYRHVFVLPAEGGTPRQLTQGPFNHAGPLAWTPAGDAVLFSANRREDWRYEPNESEIYEVRLADGELRALTGRAGPDAAPAVSPDGEQMAYLGYDDRYQGYQVTHLYVTRRDGSGAPRVLTAALDRSVADPVWSADGQGVYFGYDDRGNGKVGYAPLAGELELAAGDVGGTSIGRPYSGGSFSVAGDGRFAYTLSRPDHPADVAVGRRGASEVRRLTRLNDDLLAHKELGAVEEIWYESSHDGRRVQAWIVKPPGFEASRKHPLVLEIHGGPFANYGDRFAAELQLYAAAGYVVLYANPRGSTSYGEELGNLIHHAYPGHDYDDLMSGVDAVIARGYVDPDRLFVTGGSGGGVLTAWIVGKTGRFRAAASAKPVINWTSFALTADMYNFFYRYWFPGFPWDYPEHYQARSPLSLVGNVTTPTMLLTGEVDYRTPISESEQLYQALKLRRVDAMLVRIPGASHDIADRPSQLMSKVAHVLAWFERYRD
jgi:acylaminoacyl-peptidase